MLMDADLRMAPRLAERLGVRMWGSVVMTVLGVAGESVGRNEDVEGRLKAFFLRREGPEPREPLLALLLSVLGVPTAVLAVEGRGCGGGDGG